MLPTSNVHDCYNEPRVSAKWIETEGRVEREWRKSGENAVLD